MVLVTAKTGAVTADGNNEDVSEELTGGGGGSVVGVEPSLLFISMSCMLAECGCIVIISIKFRDGRTPIKYGPMLQTAEGLLDQIIGYSRYGLPISNNC